MVGPNSVHNSHKKIRESCNSCSSQKIRCGKERPSCARCISKGIICNYSYSQRTGRRHSSAPSSISTPTTPAASDHSVTLPTLGCSVSTNASDLPNTSHFMSTSTDQSGSDIEFPQDFDFPISYGFPWLPNESGSPSIHNTPTSNHSVPQPSSRSSDRLDYQSKDSELNTEQSVLQNQGPKDCLIRVLEVVRSLHVSVISCSTVVSDTGLSDSSIFNHLASIQPKRDDRRDIDQVFFKNRDAIKSLHRILDCGCSASPSVALACYLAAGKIIRWYRAAIGISDEAEAANDRKSMPEQIVVRPIYMGRYCLHPTTQRSVRASVVLNELKEQVQPLLTRLDRKGLDHMQRDGQAEPVDCARAAAPSDKPANALREQLREIVKEANDACQGLQRQSTSDLWATGILDDDVPHSHHGV